MLDMLFPAVAMAQEGGAAASGGGGLGSLLQGPLPILILMFVVFYFLLIRPQQKKAKQHKELLAGLKKGDAVLTTGGIYGKITGMTDNILVVEIAPQVRVKVSRGHVAGLMGTETPAPADNGKKK